MSLENILGKIKSQAFATLSAVLIAGSAYSCGEEEKQPPCTRYVAPYTLYGMYAMNYKETEDFNDLLSPDEGTYEMEIVPLGSDLKVRFNIFGKHDFARNAETGEVCDSWEEYEGTLKHHVCGTITDDGQVDLDASVEMDSYDFYGKIAVETWGTKK